MKTALTTASGKMIDLLNPSPQDIDFADIAEHLAKENRFNGATKDVTYSVAQHLVEGTREILRDQCGTQAAAYFLCHDMHEAYLKDDTTPKKKAIEAVAADFGVLSGKITEAFAALTHRWDVAIHAAAGLDWPPPPEVASLVHLYDRAMLVTEWRSFMTGDLPHGYREVDPLLRTLTPWSWTRARYAMVEISAALLPAMVRRP